jgi:hypothetical protein
VEAGAELLGNRCVYFTIKLLKQRCADIIIASIQARTESPPALNITRTRVAPGSRMSHFFNDDDSD